MAILNRLETQPALFDLGASAVDAESPAEHRRRVNAERQRRHRQRHQFFVPENAFEPPTYRTCSEAP